MDFLKSIGIRPEDCAAVIAAMADKIHNLELANRCLERQLEERDKLIGNISAGRMEGMNDV